VRRSAARLGNVHIEHRCADMNMVLLIMARELQVVLRYEDFEIASEAPGFLRSTLGDTSGRQASAWSCPEA